MTRSDSSANLDLTQHHFRIVKSFNPFPMRVLFGSIIALFLIVPLHAQAAPDAVSGAVSGTAADPPGRILLVVTSAGEMGDTGKRTGAFFPEITQPYAVFRQAGYTVDIASPQGGRTPLVAAGTRDSTSARLLYDPDFMRQIRDTTPLAQVDPSRYDAVFFAGGHGAMWDFPNDERLVAMTARMYENGDVVGAVCHGPASLVNVRLSDGSHLVEGKTVAAFTNEEEEAAGATKDMPFLLETRLRERGARFTEAPNWEEHVATDGRLVTGQNPQSARAVAHAMIEAMSKSADRGIGGSED